MAKDSKGHGSEKKGGGSAKKGPLFSPKFSAAVSDYHAAHREVMKHDRAANAAKTDAGFSAAVARRRAAEKTRMAAERKIDRQAPKEKPKLVPKEQWQDKEIERRKRAFAEERAKKPKR